MNRKQKRGNKKIANAMMKELGTKDKTSIIGALTQAATTSVVKTLSQDTLTLGMEIAFELLYDKYLSKIKDSTNEEEQKDIVNDMIKYIMAQYVISQRKKTEEKSRAKNIKPKEETEVKNS